MTRQEMFNAAYLGLKAQGFMPSLVNGPFGNSAHCAYRGADGKKCAIGHLIPDDKYVPAIELGGVYRVFEYIPKLFKGEDQVFLVDLQECHDDAYRASVSDRVQVDIQMQSNLIAFAQNRGLTVPND